MSFSSWPLGNDVPDNDRLVLVFAPSIDDPEESTIPCKHVWMGYWDAESQHWELMVPGLGSTCSVSQEEVHRWCEIPIPDSGSDHSIALNKEGWIGVDLDRTLAFQDKYISHEHIGDPIPQMAQRVRDWLAEGKDVRIFTARVDGGNVAIAMGNPEGHKYRDVERIRTIIQDWTEKHFGRRLPVTNKKDYGCIAIWDDIAIGVVPNQGCLKEPCIETKPGLVTPMGMLRKEHTSNLAAALRAAGINVGAVELNERLGDADLIRLDDDHYLSVDFEDFERVGIVHICLNIDIPYGGNPTLATWMMPPLTSEEIASAVAAELMSE
jgi:hypothetical protein